MQNSSSAFPKRYFGTAQLDTSSAADSAFKVDSFIRRSPHKRILVEFIRALPQGARLLDIGCGSGKTIRLIYALRPDIRISGMDITDMHEYLPPYAEFMQGSVDDLATLYEAQSFDAIICQHVIEHLVSPLAMMEGISATLTKHGQLYMETPNWTRLFVPFSHLYFWADYTHIHPYAVTTMSRLCSDFNMKARIKTASSCRWFPKRMKKAYGTASTRSLSSSGYDGRGSVSRIFARLVNPLLRDVLIVIAEK
jgi:2-polyprenyl-3-methyl-5-hydroxy-6-metoxy-1,4-benzoquinol methylase